MLNRIRVKMDVIEAMLYFWQASSEKEKVSEKFLVDLAEMDEMKYIYDDEFTAESVRKVLSAITNRELLSSKNKKEGRFWNYNMWVMEDLEYTNLMVQPLKKLNLDNLITKLNKENSKNDFSEIIVTFVPMHLQDYIIKDNVLVINFFKVKPSDFDERTFVGEVELEQYIYEKLMEMIS